MVRGIKGVMSVKNHNSPNPSCLKRGNFCLVSPLNVRGKMGFYVYEMRKSKWYEPHPESYGLD